MKVETHNHPTAIAPFPGAATGSGGEIRDEGATGIGAKPKAGLTGFTVSDLRAAVIAAAVGNGLRQAGSHRVGVADHARGSGRRRVVQQRIRAPESSRLLPHVRAAGGRRSSRLSQADHDRGRRRQHRGDPRAQGPASGRRAAHPAGRSRHVDRDGRRSGVVDGHRRQHGRSRFRFGAARQRRDPAARAGGDRPLLAARRGEPDPVDSRRRRGRAVQRVPGTGSRRRRGRPSRLARGAFRGTGHVAARDLVQRSAGALRARDPGRRSRALPRTVRARALSVRGHRTTRRSTIVSPSPIRNSGPCRSTWTSTCCSASRRG